MATAAVVSEAVGLAVDHGYANRGLAGTWLSGELLFCPAASIPVPAQTHNRAGQERIAMSGDFVPQTDNSVQIFDVFAEIGKLPETSESMLTDVYFSDFPEASSRIFRIYRTLPLHYHNDCDEHLYVVSGEGIFHLAGTESRAGPGMFLRFARTQIHGFPRITTHPFVVLSVDVPRRRPDDIVFADPESGDARSFMARNNV